MKTAHDKIRELKKRIEQRIGIDLDFDTVAKLRRIEMTLHRWAELECGDGNGHIERDEKTGVPYYYNDRASYAQANDPRRISRIPDRENGAIKRLRKICDFHGLHFYHQTDPRGCALYIDTKPLPENNYTSGVAVCD